MLNPSPLKKRKPFYYEFVTTQGIPYAVYFLDYSYLFSDYPLIANCIYSFNIELLDKDILQGKEDERIAHTVLLILQQFFSSLEHAVIYVCDSADNRQMVRKRKFDRWFNKYNDGNIIKEDGVIVMKGMAILSALLIHRRHILRNEIIAAFRALNDSSGEK